MADMFSYFMGKDGFHWFIGVCEDRDDPDTMGRVRCRVFGYHTDDLTKLPTQDLPWASVVLPPNAKPGEIPNITPGQWVFGFWRDPDYHQEPIILGILPGRPAETPNPSKGFNDPNSPNAPTSQSTQYRDAPDFGLVTMMAVPPLAAVLAMAASSLSVTLNTARLAWAEPDEASDSPAPALSAQRSMPPSAGQSRPTA